MNNPEYILVDEVGSLVSMASDSLIADGVLTSPINYRYGYLDEVKTMLAQYNLTTEYASLKFPLVWLVQPFTITRVNAGFYGDTKIRLFLIQESEAGLVASERMTRTFKAVLYPIYRELISQFNNASHLFDNTMNEGLAHNVTDRYYWGEEQQKQIDDVFDCMEVDGLQLKIANNANCLIPTTFFLT